MQHTQPGAPQEVLFSRRAIAAICAETLEHHPLETGGILLGHWHQQRWQVLEAIDPGPDARCTATTFEYDCAYVDHLASKLARQYRQPLQLIGLWHRHPGSFDRFSAEDDVTNQRFAALTPHGALSCLVNLDPDFRLTAFHVPKDLRYVRLPLVVRCCLDHIAHESEQVSHTATTTCSWFSRLRIIHNSRAAREPEHPLLTLISSLASSSTIPSWA